MVGDGAAEGAVATVVRAGRHEFVVDEPAGLAGDDLGPSPVEFALGALLGCQTVVYRLYAKRLGITIDRLELRAEGDLFAARLAESGVVVEHVVGPGSGHGFTHVGP